MNHSGAMSAGSSPDFATAVDHLLAKTDSLVEVRHTAEVECTTLKQLIAMMARKIQLQEHTLERQAASIADLQTEVARLRADGEAAQAVLGEVRTVARDVEEIRGDARRHATRLEGVREETGSLHRDLARVMATVGTSSAHHHHHHGGGAVDGLSTSAAATSGKSVRVMSEPTHQSVDISGAGRASAPNPFYAASLRAHGGGREGGAETPPPRGGHHHSEDPGQPRSPSAAAAADAYDVPMTPPPASHVAPIGAPPPAAGGGTPQHGARGHAAAALSSAATTPNRSQGGGAVRPLAGLDLTDTVAGPKVTALKLGGPGAAAGLKVGDTIIRLNGKEVRSKHDFVGALSRCVPGQCVDVAHRKDGHAVVVSKLYLGSASAGPR